MKNYNLEYHVNHVGTFDLYFDDYPTEEQRQFLVDRNNIIFATLWKRNNGDWVRVLDLI